MTRQLELWTRYSIFILLLCQTLRRLQLQTPLATVLQEYEVRRLHGTCQFQCICILGMPMLAVRRVAGETKSQNCLTARRVATLLLAKVVPCTARIRQCRSSRTKSLQVRARRTKCSTVQLVQVYLCAESAKARAPQGAPVERNGLRALLQWSFRERLT